MDWRHEFQFCRRVVGSDLVRLGRKVDLTRGDEDRSGHCMKQKANALKTRRAKRRIALALQGGGSHGAFTSGVLDRLLEESRFEFVCVSGTSAGAMKAAV